MASARGGRLLVEDLPASQILYDALTELKKINFHLMTITDNVVDDEEVE